LVVLTIAVTHFQDEVDGGVVERVQFENQAVIKLFEGGGGEGDVVNKECLVDLDQGFEVVLVHLGLEELFELGDFEVFCWGVG
jgi:hypothetical protein